MKEAIAHILEVIVVVIALFAVIAIITAMTKMGTVDSKTGKISGGGFITQQIEGTVEKVFETTNETIAPSVIDNSQKDASQKDAQNGSGN